MEDALQELRKALEGADIELIRRKQEALEQVSQKMGQAIYEDIAKQQAAAGAGPSANGATGSPAGAAG